MVQSEQEASVGASASPTTTITASNLILLEHVNLNVPSHDYILPFYFVLLGCGMDPRKASNLRADSSKKTLWANCGASQFHLPFGSQAQRISGCIGLQFDSLEGLQTRVTQYRDAIQGVVEEKDQYGNEQLRFVDKYNNVFLCRASAPTNTLQQPIIASSDIDTWGTIAQQFGRTRSNCRGIDFVEFHCPPNTAASIAQFYQIVLNAPTSVVTDPRDASVVAIVGCGTIDANSGRALQSLLFRETLSDNIPPYDGHHIAIYVNDFEQAFDNCLQADVVWVNPRFSDKAVDWSSALQYQQFRFKDIVDLETGETIMELEHEMRSLEHDAWMGTKTHATTS